MVKDQEDSFEFDVALSYAGEELVLTGDHQLALEISDEVRRLTH